MAANQNQASPARRITVECARRGKKALIAGCADLLYSRYDEVDDGLITVLGGESARYVLDGHEGGRSGYWPRVWAARGLLHAWDDTAADGYAAHSSAAGGSAAGGSAADGTAAHAIIHATEDDAWRVREMAAKVIARHRVGEGLDAVAGLRDDPVPRVRAAAQRAVVTLTAAKS